MKTVDVICNKVISLASLSTSPEINVKPTLTLSTNPPMMGLTNQGALSAEAEKVKLICKKSIKLPSE